jgi:hypothetical protein
MVLLKKEFRGRYTEGEFIYEKVYLKRDILMDIMSRQLDKEMYPDLSKF